MFKSISRVSAVRCSFAAHSNCLRSRTISLISVHRTSPATLYRFQLHRESTLYDKRLKEDDQPSSDAVEVSKDGLVRPGIIGDGAQLFLPGHHPLLIMSWSFERSALHAQHIRYARTDANESRLLPRDYGRWQTLCKSALPMSTKW